jgi:hypothetical protein
MNRKDFGASLDAGGTTPSVQLTVLRYDPRG